MFAFLNTDSKKSKIEQTTDQIKLANAIGSSVAVILGIALAGYKLANEMKK